MKQPLLYSFLFGLLLLSINAKAGNTQKIYIADRLIECGDKKISDCMLVKNKPKEEWQNFSDKIEGFIYEEGFEYKLLVSGSSAKGFILKKVLKKKKTEYNPAERMDKKKWFLYMLHDDSNFIRLMDTTTVFMQVNLADKSVSGKGVCNNFRGVLHTEGNHISITAVAFTRMACKGNILEGIVANMFDRMKTYKVAGNTLTLAGDGDNLMLFKTQRE